MATRDARVLARVAPTWDTRRERQRMENILHVTRKKMNTEMNQVNGSAIVLSIDF